MPVRRQYTVQFTTGDELGLELLKAHLAEVKAKHPEMQLDWDVLSKPVPCHNCGAHRALLTDPYLRQWCAYCAKDEELLAVQGMRKEELR